MLENQPIGEGGYLRKPFLAVMAMLSFIANPFNQVRQDKPGIIGNAETDSKQTPGPRFRGGDGWRLAE